MPELQSPQPDEPRPADPNPTKSDNGEGLAKLLKEMDAEDEAKEADDP